MLYMISGFIIVGVLLLLIRSARKNRLKARERMIDSYQFPQKVREQLLVKYAHLTEEDVDTVFRGLRDYFHICNEAGERMVAMPSQVVDVAWHELILFTKKYERFCAATLGRFLHHTPAEAMSSPTVAQEGIKRAWRIACAREGINPTHPSRLPLIFEIDTLLNIPDGFRYSLNCQQGVNSNNTSGCGGYCATHIGCSSGCAGGLHAGDSVGDNSSGCSSCGSGCGGGGD